MNGYRVVLVDPPWHYKENWGNGAAEHHYATMSLDRLKSLPVGDFALPDCALFLWTTDPMLEDAMGVIRAWGFKFVTAAFYYVKENRDQRKRRFFMGTGYYLRGNVEPCLLGIRGAMSKYRQARDVEKLIVRQRLGHSEKPPEAHQRIERIYPGPYLELFGRQERPGWTVLGDAIDGLDIAESLERLRQALAQEGVA